MYGIFTYIYHKNQLNVGKYTSPMDPMGNDGFSRQSFVRFSGSILRKIHGPQNQSSGLP